MKNIKGIKRGKKAKNHVIDIVPVNFNAINTSDNAGKNPISPPVESIIAHNYTTCKESFWKVAIYTHILYSNAPRASSCFSYNIKPPCNRSHLAMRGMCYQVLRRFACLCLTELRGMYFQLLGSITGG
jgi:hypothetical protein